MHINPKTKLGYIMNNTLQYLIHKNDLIIIFPYSPSARKYTVTPRMITTLTHPSIADRQATVHNVVDIVHASSLAHFTDSSYPSWFTLSASAST